MSLEPPQADLAEIVTRAATSLQLLSGSEVLVTGAAGFLGSYFCHALARANQQLAGQRCSITCLDNFTTGTPDRLGSLHSRDDVTFVDASLENLNELHADIVIHAASIASPPVYRRLPLETIRVNVIGTWRLLQLAAERGTRSVLHLSSSEVYGDPDAASIPTPEDYIGRVSFTGPRACYDESKRLAETLCRLYFERHALPIKVARPFNVYGPTLRLDDGRVIPDLLRQGLSGGPMMLHSDGTPTRSFCYVTDAITACLDLLASERNGEAFNVGTTEEISIQELANILAGILNVREIRNVPSDETDYLTDNPKRRCPNIRKIREDIGWSPRVALRDGLARTVDYYRSAAPSRL